MEAVLASPDQRMAYQRELHGGDTVVVREMAAQTLLVGAHLDTQLRKSCPFPDAVSARARAALTRCELPWAG